MTELELDQLPPTEADEDSQQVTVTIADVRTVVAEEIHAAVQGLVTHADLEGALKKEHADLTRLIDERVNSESERRIQQITTLEQSQRDQWKEHRESIERIERQISNALQTWTTTIQAVASTNNDHAKRVGDLEKTDDVQAGRITAVDGRVTEVKETFSTFIDDVSRRMEVFTAILMGNDKSGQISLGQRIDRVVGTSARNEERLEVVETWVLTEIKRREQWRKFMSSYLGAAINGGGAGLILTMIGKILFGG